MNRYIQCPCDTKLLYNKCCGQYHDGKPAGSALTLMRSRYSAYALNLPDYIIQTTHPDNPHYSADQAAWRKEVELFSKHTQFQYLHIDEFIDGEKFAYVTFTANLAQNGADMPFTEKSKFVREGDRWFYLDGQALSSPSSGDA